MKTFENQCAQGDMLISRIEKLPAGIEEIAANGGEHIIAHSETGHHHVMEAEHVKMYRLPEEIYECFLLVEQPTPLRHLRDFDTHEPILVGQGAYRVRRQRENTPEGFRRLED